MSKRTSMPPSAYLKIERGRFSQKQRKQRKQAALGTGFNASHAKSLMKIWEAFFERN